MRIRGLVVAAALSGALLGAQLVCAQQTLYKLIDKNGKITYSNEKPKDFDGQVIELNINPEANTASLPKPGPEGFQRVHKDAKGKPVSPQELLAQAQERLEKAKAALKAAKDNPGPDDVMMVGKVGGGVRNIQSEDYQKRLEQLEQDVKDAEDNLARVEKGG